MPSAGLFTPMSRNIGRHSRVVRRIHPLCTDVAVAILRSDQRMETPMARKPNYSFERQERERAAAKKAADKAALKAERKAEAAGEKSPPEDQSAD